MNIFFLSPSPLQSAVWMCDSHVVKMIVESAQLLSTAHRILDGVEQVGVSSTGRKTKGWVLPDSREQIMYKTTHSNHPCAIWCRTSIENYTWLVEHFFALCDEYTYRYGKTHKCYGMGYALQSPPLNLKAYDWTTPPSCMPEQYILSDNPVENYRQYYREGKKHILKWKNRPQPDWIEEVI